MTKMLQTNEQKQKQYLKNICSQRIEWKKAITKTKISIGVIIAATIGTICVNLTCDDPVIITTINIILICLLIITSLTDSERLNEAKKKCIYPYGTYTHETLIITDKYIIYKFWKKQSDMKLLNQKKTDFKKQDMFVYSIQKANIRKITIHNNICQITGDGILTQPVWAKQNEYEELNKHKKDFSFLMAFDDEDTEQILKTYI